MKRFLVPGIVAFVAVMVIADSADAGLFRRGRRGGGNCCQSQGGCGGGGCGGGGCQAGMQGDPNMMGPGPGQNAQTYMGPNGQQGNFGPQGNVGPNGQPGNNTFYRGAPQPAPAPNGQLNGGGNVGGPQGNIQGGANVGGPQGNFQGGANVGGPQGNLQGGANANVGGAQGNIQGGANAPARAPQ